MRTRWLGLMGFVGCSGAESTLPPPTTSVSDTGADTDTLQGLSSTVSVSQTAGVSGVVHEVVTALWASLDPPPAPLALDSCEVVDAASGVASAFSGVPSPLSDGERTVALDGVPVPLDPDGAALLATWPAGQSLSFAATGDTFPAFDAPDLLTVPPSPDPITDSPAPLGAVEVSWSVAPSPAQITLIADGNAGVVLVCDLVDDGAHLIDPDQLYLVGGAPQWTVTRTVAVSVDAGGVSVSGLAAATAMTR